jgi:DNA polymerase III subunit delta
MSDKKVVVVYRASFLGEGKVKKTDKNSKASEENIELQNLSEEGEISENNESQVIEDVKFSKDTYKDISDYVKNSPPHCVLIMYYVFNNKREKISDKIKKLDKKICVVSAGKPRRDSIEKKAKQLFEERGKEIDNVELKLFCREIENKLNTITNEVEKLCAYTMGRKITKEDIMVMLPSETDNDIFDFVDALGDKNIEKAIDILNELTYKGQKVPIILRMVERQFNLLFKLKASSEHGKSKEVLASEFKLHPYVCGKMIDQTRKFTLGSLKKALELCLNAEEALKSSSVNPITEMELLIVNTVSR